MSNVKYISQMLVHNEIISIGTPGDDNLKIK